MRYKIVLFDLDGTLVDSSYGICSSVAYALDKKGIHHDGIESLMHFVGPPLKEEFMKSYNLDDSHGAEMVELYRENYRTKGIFQCEMYDGIKELLALLKKEGAVVLTATSKPELFAKTVLEHFGVAEYFDYIAGANMDNTRTDKAEVISYAIKSLGLENQKKDIVMVGDHFVDIIGACKMGVDSVFVSYGFGQLEKSEVYVPVTVCDTVKELESFLLK